MTYKEETEIVKKNLREVIDSCDCSVQSVKDALNELVEFYSETAYQYSRNVKICDLMASQSET